MPVGPLSTPVLRAIIESSTENKCTTYVATPRPRRISLVAPPTHPVLQQLHRLDLSSSDFRDKLHQGVDQILHVQAYEGCAKNLEREDLVWFVDYPDKVRHHNPLPRSPLKPMQTLDSQSSRLRFLEVYTRTQKRRQHSCDSPNMMYDRIRLTVDSLPFASGGFGDMHNGPSYECGVGMPCHRPPMCFFDSIAFLTRHHERILLQKMFCQEAVMRKYLQHPTSYPSREPQLHGHPTIRAIPHFLIGFESMLEVPLLTQPLNLTKGHPDSSGEYVI